MFLKCNDGKKSDSKCDLMKETCDSIEIDSSDLVMPKKSCQKWYIFNLTLLLAFVTLLTWTMVSKYYQSPATSPIKIDDEIFTMTMRIINKTEVVLKEIQEQADTIYQKNQQAALQYVNEIQNMLNYTVNVGVEKVNKVTNENLSSIREELLALDTITKDIFDGLVSNFQSNIDKVINILASAEEKDLISALREAIAQARYEVTVMWNNMDHMYSYYSSYTTHIIREKAQNMTARINGLVASQRRKCDCFLDQRINICYNISLANIEASQTVQKLVHTINNLYNTTDKVKKLYDMHLNGDEHALTVIGDSTSLLSAYKDTSQKLLVTLLSDHNYFLGSAIRQITESTYPHIKQFILRSWKSALENASTGVNFMLTIDPLIKEEYHHRIINDAMVSLQKLRELIESKASLLNDEAMRQRFTENTDFVKLGYLMDYRFSNVTGIINTIYTKDLWATATLTKNNVESIINKKLPYIFSVTIQNFLPTDVCPLAVDFANFLYRFLRTDLFVNSENDILDFLLPEFDDNIDIISMLNTQTEDDDTSTQDLETLIQFDVKLVTNDYSKGDKMLVSSTGKVTVDNAHNNDSYSVSKPQHFLSSDESITINEQNKLDSVKPNQLPSNYNVEPKVDEYREEKPEDDDSKADSIYVYTDNIIQSDPTEFNTGYRTKSKSAENKSSEERQIEQLTSPYISNEGDKSSTQSSSTASALVPVPIEPIIHSTPIINTKPFDTGNEPKFSSLQDKSNAEIGDFSSEETNTDFIAQLNKPERVSPFEEKDTELKDESIMTSGEVSK